jgi:hypothetical protein
VELVAGDDGKVTVMPMTVAPKFGAPAAARSMRAALRSA